MDTEATLHNTDLLFCSTGDEDRMGGSFLVGEEIGNEHPFIGVPAERRMARMGNHPMGAWTQRRRTRF